MKKENDKINTENNIEKCIMCGCDTPYKYTDNILFRNYYVTGCGQLCEKCYYEIYGNH